MKPEDKLLFDIYSGQEILSVHDKEVDWNIFIQTLHKQKLFMHFYSNYSMFVPNEYKKKFQYIYLIKCNERKLNIRSLIKLMNILLANNLEIFMIKGYVFSMLIYDNLYSRDFNDIDILVKESDMERFDGILRNYGFIPKRNGKTFNKLTYKGYKPPNNVETYDYSGLIDQRNFVLDIQRYLQCIYKDHIADMFDNTQYINLEENIIKVLSIENNFLNLLTHVYVHTHVATPDYYGKITLRDYVDIKEFIKKYKDKIDWTDLRKRVENYQINAEICTVIEDTNQIFPNEIPDTIMDLFHCKNKGIWYKDLCIKKWDSPIINRIFDPDLNECARIIAKNIYSNKNIHYSNCKYSVSNKIFVDEKYQKTRFKYSITSLDDVLYIKLVPIEKYNILIKDYNIAFSFLIRKEDYVIEVRYILYFNQKLCLKKEIQDVFGSIITEQSVDQYLKKEDNPIIIYIPYEDILLDKSQKSNIVCYELFLIENIEGIIESRIDFIGFQQDSPHACGQYTANGAVKC